MLSKRLLWHYGGPFYNFYDNFAKLSDFLINSKRAVSFLISLFLVLIDEFVGCTTVLVPYVFNVQVPRHIYRSPEFKSLDIYT